ncbi:MAG: hydrolase [Sphingobacteriales bacterium 41-5]|nr:MAG: hydrolase [Sphingobacteriales bacterium 41-5]
MKFTYYGQSCFQIELNEKIFLFDPFISGNELAKEIDINSLRADYILVSHGHEDHNLDILPIAKNTGALVISNFEIIAWLQLQGVSNVHPMNFGSYDFEFGTLTYMQAQHSSSLADSTYAGAAGGFILKSEHGNFYYSGDTSLMLDMQLVPYYAKIDVAILPVGGNFTMNVRDALKATEFIQCDNVVGVHFDTFGYIKIDHVASIKLFEQAGKKLLLPEIGKTYEL